MHKGVFEVCYLPLAGKFLVMVPCNSPAEGAAHWVHSLPDAKTGAQAQKQAQALMEREYPTQSDRVRMIVQII